MSSPTTRGGLRPAVNGYARSPVKPLIAMRIIELDSSPFYEITFLNAARRGGVETQRLPLLRGRVDRLPDALDALLITSDLQGVAPSLSAGGANALLGEILAEEYERLAAQGMVPLPERTGVILAGDMYSAPAGDKRGASGDVREVWLTFAAAYRWVAGVGGNHDRFGSQREHAAFCSQPGIAFLDGAALDLDGICIAGVSGIIGNPDKPGRRTEEDFIETLNRALDQSPDILVLHEGPSGSDGQRGNPVIRETVELGAVPLTICGHSHWDTPMASIGDGRLYRDTRPLQVLNVDARAVVLVAGARSSSA